MSAISSRTPEGWPARCPICEAEVALQASDPLGDAPCPNCGTLLWPLPYGAGSCLLPADELPSEKREHLRELVARYAEASGGFDSLDRAELAMELEDILGLEVGPEAVDECDSLEELLILFLRRKGAQ